MKIYNNYYCHNKNINFNSHQLKIYDRAADKIYYTYTEHYRSDLDWQKFFHFILKKYKNVDKVNTVVEACSVGEEANSLALKFLDLGSEGKKFLNIAAKDFNTQCINIAKAGIFQVSSDEFKRMQTFINEPIEKYYSHEDKVGYIEIKPKNILKDQVVFSQADITRDVYRLPKENLLLFCRNFWPYLESDESYNLASALAFNLKPDSTIVLGNFDVRNGYGDLLVKNGFRQTEVPLVYEKIM
jgi:chemotaxis methyl-accepting protein methylase